MAALAQPFQRLAGRSERLGQHVPRLDLAGEDEPVGGVVVHDEHALALQQGLHLVQVDARAAPVRPWRGS